MKSVYWTIPVEKCEAEATSIMLEKNGLEGDGKKQEMMRDMTLSLMDRAKERLEDIKACYLYTDDVRLEGDVLSVDGEEFCCSAFSQIDPDWIKGAYIYCMTAGNYEFDDMELMEQILMDLWGTAFVTASNTALKEELEKERKLSEVMGPGLFGMPIEYMKTLIHMLPADEIHLEVRDSCFLDPVKSYGGIFLEVTEDYEPLKMACRECLGKNISCNLCQWKRR